jgi:hypothetical protein
VAKEKTEDLQPGIVDAYTGRDLKPACAMDNLVRAFANTLSEYMERSARCWAASPEECKKMMTMDFPSVQTMAMRDAIRCIGRLPFESTEAAKEIMEYLKTKYYENKTE